MSRSNSCRPCNEDSFAALPEIGLFMIADDLGGRPAGDVASRLAMDIVRRCFEYTDPDETWPHRLGGTVSDRDEARLILSVQTANREILERNCQMPG